MKLLVFVVAVIAVIDAASIFQKSADIPVQVVYDEKPESVRNLEEKPKAEALTETKTEEIREDVKESLQAEEAQVQVKVAQALKNLEEKPQLSQDEVLTVRQSPLVQDELQTIKIVTPEDSVLSPAQPIVAQPLQPIQPISLGQEQNIDDIYDKIQEIILNGAKKIEIEFEKLPKDSKYKKEVLEKVNCTLKEFLESTKKLIESKAEAPGTLKQQSTIPPPPNPQNIFQQIMNSFQTFSSNLFSGLNPNNANTQNDGTTASTPQVTNPIQMAQNAFTQLQNNLGGLFGLRPPGSQSDEQSGQPNNPLQIIQQTFQNIFRPPSTAAPGSQGDDPTPTPSNNPLGFIQTAFQNVGNIFQPSTTSTGAPPVAPVTENTQNPIQNVLGALGQTNPDISNQISQVSTNPIAQQGQMLIEQQIQQQSGNIPTIPNTEAVQGAATQIQQAITQVQGTRNESEKVEKSEPIPVIESQAVESSKVEEEKKPIDNEVGLEDPVKKPEAIEIEENKKKE